MVLIYGFLISIFAVANTTESKPSFNFPGVYSCKSPLYQDVVEAELIESSIGTRKIMYMVVTHLTKEFRNNNEVDIEGPTTKRTIPGTDTYYDLGSHSLRFNERNGAVTLNNYKSSNSAYECRRK